MGLYVDLGIAALISLGLSFVVSDEQPWHHGSFFRLLTGWLVFLVLVFHFIFNVH